MASVWFISGMAVTSTVVLTAPTFRLASTVVVRSPFTRTWVWVSRLETLFGDRQLVSSGRELRYRVGAVRLRVRYHFKVCRAVERLDRRIRHGGARRIRDRTRDDAQSLLRLQRLPVRETKKQQAANNASSV